jgi:hypothetical protein
MVLSKIYSILDMPVVTQTLAMVEKVCYLIFLLSKVESSKLGKKVFLRRGWRRGTGGVSF